MIKDIKQSIIIVICLFIFSCLLFWGASFFHEVKFPLPTSKQDLKIADDVPEALSAMVGEWKGTWDRGIGKFYSLMGYSTESLLIINEIQPSFQSPKAKIIFSIGNENAPAETPFFPDNRITKLSKGWTEHVVDIEFTPLPKLSWIENQNHFEFIFVKGLSLFQGKLYSNNVLLSSIELHKTNDLYRGLNLTEWAEFAEGYIYHIIGVITKKGYNLLIFAGIPFFIFCVWRKKKWASRRIQRRFPTNADMRRELYHAGINLIILGVMSGFFLYLWSAGFTRIYPNISDYGWIYFVLSIVIAFLALDTYFYWIHRLLHHPKIYRFAHHIHHQSISPSPWATTAVAPLEQLPMSLFYLALLCTVPMHYYAYTFFIFVSTIRSVIGHLGYEIFPKGFLSGPFRWCTTVTHHEMHHQYFNYNYGLYFNWWDKIMKTNHKDYKKVFEQVTEGKITHDKT